MAVEKGLLLGSQAPAPKSRTGKAGLSPIQRALLVAYVVLEALYLYLKVPYWLGRGRQRSYAGEHVQWHRCGDITGHDLECSSIVVPMDQFDADNPGDKTFEIPIIRMRGYNATHGQNILFNPGGPGGSGMSLVYNAGEHLNTMVGEGYHIVSFDPRGVNSSRPQALCYPEKDTRQKRSPHRNRDIIGDSPDVYAWTQNFVQACADTAGDHGAYINTPQTAADMNSILDALGQDKLVYWGLSYGTLLGQTYASLFPQRVGRAVIDGVVNMYEWYTSEPSMESMSDADRVLEAFFDECVQADTTCALNEFAASKAEMYEKVFDLGEKLKQQPASVYLNNTHYGTLDWEALWLQGVFRSMYQPKVWYDLASILSSLMQGNATDAFIRYGLRENPVSEMDAFNIVFLNDGLTGPEHWPQDREALLEVVLPLINSSSFGPLVRDRFYKKQQWRIPRNHDFVPRKGVETANPLLILSTTYDPITPFASAKSARDSFEGSRLIEIKGYGHTSLASPSSCAIEHARRYLYDGVVPEDDATCEKDVTIFLPPEAEASSIWGAAVEDPERLEVLLAQQEIAEELYDWTKLGIY